MESSLDDEVVGRLARLQVRDLCAAERPVVQAGSDERAGDAQMRESDQIIGIAYAAGRVNAPSAACIFDRLKPCPIGTHAAADTRKRHRYDSAWPRVDIA